MSNTLIAFAEARAKLAEILGRAQDHHERFTITVHGQPAGVLLSVYEYESLMETLDILNDPAAMAALKESEEDVAAGRVYSDEDAFPARKTA
jgi:prevent-host-death family protein